MIRLGLLMLATLLGLYVVLTTMGDGDLRAQRPAVARPDTTVQDAVGLGAAAAEPLPAEAPPEIIPAAIQTPEQVVQFPGPPLEPSPEHAGQPSDAVEADAQGTLYVTATRLNLRSGPGPDSSILSALDRGTGVMPVGPAQGEWIEVTAPGGPRGFVSTQFLSAEAP